MNHGECNEHQKQQNFTALKHSKTKSKSNPVRERKTAE